MAEKSFFLQFLFTLAFLSFFHSVFSRTTSHHYTTTLFDVSASIQRTLDVLSFDPQSLLKPTKQEDKVAKPIKVHPPISLSLHPRSSIHKAHHQSYQELTKSRLDRDRARVNSIISKLQIAINGVNRSELKPVGNTVFQAEALQTPLTSGASQGSGEYFSRVGLGTPAKQYYMVIDTGSDLSWLQCQPCFDCYQQSDPIFDPSASSSYRSLNCDSPQCNALQVSGCRVNSCLYQVSYGDGSFTVGSLATERLWFGNSGSVNNIAIGCGHDNEGLFVGSAGLLGLGGGELSVTKQLRATSFSYCLVDRDSTSSSTLEFNSARPGDSFTAPLLRNAKTDTYLYVGLAGLSVGGRPVPLPTSVFAVDGSGNGGIIVDSGTAVTRLKTEAYEALRDAFVQQAPNLPKTSGYAIFDTCFDLSSMKQVSIPTVGFRFSGGRTLTLKPENYMVPVESDGKFCFAFAPTDGPLSIIGNIQQQGTRVSYDLANSLVGFSPNKC